jgi:hypothetical protein
MSVDRLTGQNSEIGVMSGLATIHPKLEFRIGLAECYGSRSDSMLANHGHTLEMIREPGLAPSYWTVNVIAVDTLADPEVPVIVTV